MAPKSALRVRSSGSVASNRRSGARGGVESAGVWLADAPVATHTPTKAVSAAPHLRLTRSKPTEQVYGRRGGLASGSPGLAPGVSQTVSSSVSGPWSGGHALDRRWGGGGGAGRGPVGGGLGPHPPPAGGGGGAPPPQGFPRHPPGAG